MKTITPEGGFTAYPNGKRRHFAAGVAEDVSNELAEQLAAKGLVTVAAEAKNTGRGKPAADETGAADTALTTDPETAE